VLPANTSISKDAVLALTKSATVFISHLAGEANDMTDRKTVQSQDVLKALREIEMDGVMGMGGDGRKAGRVEREVEKWEGDVRGKRKGYREKVKARESGVGDTTVGTVDTALGEEGEERENKRVRIGEEDEEGRDESAGPITDGTNRLKLNIGRAKSDEDEENGDGDEVGDEDESEQDEDNDDADASEHDDAREVDESAIDIDPDVRRNHGTLAPDGRVEVGASDDESE